MAKTSSRWTGTTGIEKSDAGLKFYGQFYMGKLRIRPIASPGEPERVVIFLNIYFTRFITAQLGYQLGGEGREVLEGVKAGLSEIKEGV